MLDSINEQDSDAKPKKEIPNNGNKRFLSRLIYRDDIQNKEYIDHIYKNAVY